MTETGEGANDAVKVAPNLHEVIFENDKVRVIKVTVKPGDRAKMHWHPDNLNYVLSSGRLRFTKNNGSHSDIALNEGEVISSASGRQYLQATIELRLW